MELLEKHKTHYIVMESIPDLIIDEYISATTRRYTQGTYLLFKAYDLTTAIAQSIEFGLYGVYPDDSKYDGKFMGITGVSGFTGVDTRFEAAKKSLKELPPGDLPLLIDFFHHEKMTQALTEILSE